MIKLFFTLTFLLFFYNGFTQYLENYQPDSVYKINAVKTRILVYNKSKISSKFIEQYDKQGRHIESIRVEAGTKNYLSRTLFEYDSLDRLVNEYYISYFSVDSNTPKLTISEATPDTTFVVNKYDSLNRLVSKIKRNKAGKVFNIGVYQYDPLTITEEHTDINDSLPNYRYTTIYERPNIPKHFIGYNSSKINKSEFEYTYENTFDVSGRLIKRITYYTNLNSPAQNNTLKTAETFYEYNTLGLLIKQTITSNYQNSIRNTILLFDYKYW